MILNDKKGWFGSFSAAGKGSAQKYNAFTKKNRRKKAKIYNPFDHHNLKEKAGDKRLFCGKQNRRSKYFGRKTRRRN